MDFLGIPKQLGTVEGDDQESDDELSHPIENHPPQLEKSTEQNELTDIEQIYTDLEEPQVPGYPEPTQSTEYPEQPEPIPEAAAEKTEPEDFSAYERTQVPPYGRKSEAEKEQGFSRPGGHPYPPYQPPTSGHLPSSSLPGAPPIGG